MVICCEYWKRSQELDTIPVGDHLSENYLAKEESGICFCQYLVSFEHFMDT